MRSPPNSPRRRHIGFTLVELLVVIGIIALLISILMPSLARARASGVLIDCQARMRSFGQAMQIYAAQYKGTLPAAMNPSVDGSRPVATVLSQMLGTQDWDINPAFNDKDTVEPIGGGGSVVGDNPYSHFVGPYTSHYTPSSRLFPAPAAVFGDRYDGTAGGLSFGGAAKKQTAYRNLGSIKNSSECAAWWDAAQVKNFGGSGTRRMYAAYPYSDGTGEWAWHTALYGRMVNYDNQLSGYDGSMGVVVATNSDPDNLGTGQSQGGIRYRHMNNTTANILYADGHVGSHTFNKATGKSSMPLRELGANWVPPVNLP
jgi:prepilin-type processing-associated H-X9-DG protein/prepilin-type N-terminal cleavage/methylation domain-containing protein